MFKERFSRSNSPFKPQPEFSRSDRAGAGTALLDNPPHEQPTRVEFKPLPPASLKDAGLNDEMVDSIALKFLLTAGSATGAQCANLLGLPHPLVVERLADLKRQQLVGYVGAATMGDFTYTLSDAGRDRAHRTSAGHRHSRRPRHSRAEPDCGRQADRR